MRSAPGAWRRESARLEPSGPPDYDFTYMSRRGAGHSSKHERPRRLLRADGGVQVKGWRRRTLPPGRPGSTIRAGGLNDRVRYGNGCDPSAKPPTNAKKN